MSRPGPFATRGKIMGEYRLGLGLSGGGFRASFFHIGVLARMAELGLLRQVEFISTVSGGSIVGAAYYISLKQMLENNQDEDIDDSHYIDIVRKLEESFKEAVQKNIRMRTFINPLANIRMGSKRFSRSDQIGILYEKHIYRKLMDSKKLKNNEPINMTDLIIDLKKDGKSFHPYDDEYTNADRQAKVPILVINAASLNTGHNWVFTARNMGEIPPRNENFRDIDKKDQYLRRRYAEISPRKGKVGFPLGKAVAASAAVPGLFPPMAVSDMFKDRTVQLVDGGVFDNQGIAGLMDTESNEYRCTHFVISDASGQGEATDKPGTNMISVLAQMSNLLLSRVREEMVNNLIKVKKLSKMPDLLKAEELSETDKLSMMQNLVENEKSDVAYVHLTRELAAKNIPLKSEGDKSKNQDRSTSGNPGITTYNVASTNQELLSDIRTDLDSFSDYEIYALEKDAYLMSEAELAKFQKTFAPKKASPPADVPEWLFEKIGSRLKNPGDKKLIKNLTAGSNRLFKPFRLNFPLAFIAHLPLLIVLIAMGAAIYGVPKYFYPDFWTGIMHTSLKEVLVFLGSIAASYLLSFIADQFQKGAGRVVTVLWNITRIPSFLISFIIFRIIFPIFGAIPVFVYVFTANPVFIYLGRLDLKTEDQNPTSAH